MNNKVIEQSVLQSVFGTEGVEELKSKLIDMIVEEVRDQLQGSSNYIISPEDICCELYKDIYKECKEEYMRLKKEEIFKKLDEQFNL